MPGGGDPMTALINSAARGSNGPSSSSSSSSSRGIFGAASTGLSRMQLEQVIGVSAMAGTSLLVFKIAMYAVRNNNDNKGEDNDSSEDDENNDQQKHQQQLGRAASLSLLGFIRRILRKLLLDDPEASRDAAALEHIPERGDGTIITHQGSCHCESIQFELLAPRCLKAMEGPGKDSIPTCTNQGCQF